MEKKPVKVEKPRERKGYSQTYYYTKDRKGRSVKPSVAGILLIFIGVIGILSALILGGVALMFFAYGPEFDVDCSILGRVTDTQGDPIEGATVSAIDKGHSTITDENGFFALMNLDMGLNEIRIHKSGYIIQQNTYWLNNNGNINVSQYEEEYQDWKEDQYWGEEYWNDDDGDDDYYDHENFEDDEEFERNHNFFLIRLNEGSGIDESDLSDFKDTNLLCFMGTLCIGFILICSIITLGGGILAIMRKGYGFAILGCITGIFSIAFPLSVIFCMIAFVLLIMSYEEFFPGRKKRPYKPKKKTVTWKGYEPPPPKSE
jgi:hypothetical protein